MALDDKRFQTLADDTLDQLLAAIEDACADGNAPRWSSERAAS